MKQREAHVHIAFAPDYSDLPRNYRLFCAVETLGAVKRSSYGAMRLNDLPIGIQFGIHHSDEHLLIETAAFLEKPIPWQTANHSFTLASSSPALACVWRNHSSTHLF